MDGKKRYETLKRLEKEAKPKVETIPAAVANTMPVIGTGPTKDEINRWEQVNRTSFKNYVPGNNLPYVPNESATGDVSLDRPMIILGQGTSRREIPTDVLRKVLGDNPTLFKGIDMSNYQTLQNTIQHAYRSGHTGIGLLDNLLLKYAQKGG